MICENAERTKKHGRAGHAAASGREAVKKMGSIKRVGGSATEYLVIAAGRVVWRTERYADAVGFRWGWGASEATIARVVVEPTGDRATDFAVVSPKVSTKRATTGTRPTIPRAKTLVKTRVRKRRSSGNP
jgi:hypothetical protein